MLPNLLHLRYRAARLGSVCGWRKKKGIPVTRESLLSKEQAESSAADAFIQAAFEE
jgi:hypothetical protein